MRLKEISLNQLDPNFKFEVASRLGGKSLMACFSCGACTGACPVKGINEAFDPRKIIHMVLLGMKEKVIGDDIIWHCISCSTCSFVCPQDVKFSEIIAVLRDISSEGNYVHPSFRDLLKKIDKFSLELRGQMLCSILNKKNESLEIDLKELVRSIV
jgi:heterodisulfide reductase subunit C